MSKKLEHVYFSSTIQLNVGGHRFTTSLHTLTKDPNSMLAAMFSGKFEMKPSEDRAFFVDRDGTHFRIILNYLRNGKTIPEGATFLKELADEAEFYQIRGILEELMPEAPKNSEESVIRAPNQASWLAASVSPRSSSCKVIRIPESRKFLLVESRILSIGIQNPAFGIQNPDKE